MRRDRAVCIHEAGHAVVAEALGIPMREVRVFTDPSKHYWMAGRVVLDKDYLQRTGKEWPPALVMAGGPVANAIDEGGPVDWNHPAYRLDLNHFRVFWGATPEMLRGALTVASRDARRILEERWERVLQVAEWLDEERAAEEERERRAEARRHARRRRRLTWAAAAPLIALFSLGLVPALAWLFGGFAETDFVGLLTLALWVAGSLAIYRGTESWVEGFDGEPPWGRPPEDIRQGQAVEDCMHVALGSLVGTSRHTPVEEAIGRGDFASGADEPAPLRDAIRARARQTGRSERAVRENLRAAARHWPLAKLRASLNRTLEEAIDRWSAEREGWERVKAGNPRRSPHNSVDQGSPGRSPRTDHRTGGSPDPPGPPRGSGVNGFTEVRGLDPRGAGRLLRWPHDASRRTTE